MNNRLILFLFVTLISCKQKNISSSKYIGVWAETKFEYFFKSNNRFVFTTNGHFGNTISEGKYVLVDSIIFLHPNTDWNLRHGVLKSKLIIREGANCIQDLDNNFYCNDGEQLNQMIDKEVEQQEKIKDRLLELPKVKEVLAGYPNYNNFDPKYPHFAYNGIIILNCIQHHSFYLRVKAEKPNYCNEYFSKIQYHNYLVNLSENIIYKHHSYRDSLSMEGFLFKN